MSSTTRRCAAGSESRKEASRLRKISANSNFLSVMASAPKSDWSAAGLVGWWLSLSPGWRQEDRAQLSASWCVRAAGEWSADQCRHRADEERGRDGEWRGEPGWRVREA